MDDPMVVAPAYSVEVPSAWMAWVPILNGLVRTALAAGGAFGWTWARTVSGSDVEMAIGAGMVAAAGMWSAGQKVYALFKRWRMAEASAVASAHATMEAGQPVPIVVPPSPPGTTAADLNRAELQRIAQGGRP